MSELSQLTRAAVSLLVLLQVAVVPAAVPADDRKDADQAAPSPCSVIAQSLPNFLAAARSDTGLFRVDVFAQSTPLPVNELLTLLVIVRGNRGTSDPIELSQVSADMPAHRHGMNTQPVVRPCTVDPATGLTGFIVDGVQLHMPGVWTLEFDGRASDTVDRAQIDIRI